MNRVDRSDSFTASGRRLVTDRRPELRQLSVQPDFRLRDEGSIVILDPLNEQAESWGTEHLEESVLRWGRGFVIEPRYVGAIVDGLVHEGFALEAL